MTKQPDWVDRTDWRQLPETAATAPEERAAPKTISNLRLRKVPYMDSVIAEGECNGAPFRKVIDGCEKLRAMPIAERHHHVKEQLADDDDLELDDFDKLLPDSQEDEDELEEEEGE